MYVHVEFDEGGRSYAYHHNGADEIGPGAIVEVETRRGRCNVKVVAVGQEPPRDARGRLIETRPIVRMVEPAAEAAAATGSAP